MNSGDIQVASHLAFGIGAQAARNVVGRDLPAVYGSDQWGGMALSG